MKAIFQRPRLLATITFLLALSLAALIITDDLARQKEQHIQNANYLLSSSVDKLQYAIDSRLLNTDILAMVIVDGGGVIHDFDAIASKLYDNDSAIQSLQLAPNGVVSYIYPLAGNEKGLGDLFNNPERRTEAIAARDTGQMTLAGPVELYQGGTGVIARKPIYIPDQNGRDQFWGFSIIILNVPEIFEKANLNVLPEQGYNYRIWRTNPDTDTPQTIIESTSDALTEPLCATLAIPNGHWQLELAPAAGWLSQRHAALEVLIGLFISLLVALAIYGLLTSELQKKALAELVHHDALTGLYNERYLSDILKKLTSAQAPFGLLYLDLDGFKQVNDTFGHDCGDRLLTTVAARISSCLDDSKDLAFRIGGDEFAAIIRGAHDAAFYEQLKQSIHTAVHAPYAIEQTTIYPRISCGCARYPDDQTDSDRLIKLADMQMYDEKKQHHCAQ